MNKRILIVSKRIEPLQFAEVVRQRLSLAQFLFLTIVVVPTLLAALFYGAIASNRYISEASFIVRGASSQSSGSGLAGLLRSFGFSRADDDTFVVQDFMQSRQAVSQLEQRIPLREIFGRPGIDWFSRFPHFWRRNSFESLFDYYLSRVSVNYSTSTGITQLTVTAFRPEDAQALAKSLLALSEGLVNQMNERAQRDAIEHAQQELQGAEDKVVSSQAAITAFRNRELIVDPSSNSSKALDIVEALTSDLVNTRAQIQETMTSSPNNPSIPAMKNRVAALEDQIFKERSKLVGGDNALASKMSAYDNLVLNREFSDNEFTLASSVLELARQEARRQHIYIETISEPNLPDDTTEPRRWRGFLTVFIFSSAIFAMVWFFAVGAREQLHG
jgi:capsular polysaccharide transport system permease protein